MKTIGGLNWMLIEQRDIILLPFRYMDSDEEKERPALVISGKYVNDDAYNDMIVCGISSHGKQLPFDIPIDKNDDENPYSKMKPSRIIPHKIKLESQNRIKRRVGKISEGKCHDVITNLMKILNIEK